MIKAVIFDMDGILVDSGSLHRKIEDIVLKQYGYSFKDIEGMYPDFIGRTLLDCCKMMVEHLNLPATPEEFAKKRKELYLGSIKDLKAMPEAADRVCEAKEKGYMTAIATSGVRQYVELVLDLLNIRDKIDLYVCADDIAHSKPHPEIYFKTADKLGLKPEECVVLEDAKNGVVSAKAAGMKCIGIQEGEVNDQDLSTADIIVQNMKTLDLTIIKKLEDD